MAFANGVRGRRPAEMKSPSVVIKGNMLAPSFGCEREGQRLVPRAFSLRTSGHGTEPYRQTGNVLCWMRSLGGPRGRAATGQRRVTGTSSTAEMSFCILQRPATRTADGSAMRPGAEVNLHASQIQERCRVLVSVFLLGVQRTGMEPSGSVYADRSGARESTACRCAIGRSAIDSP